MYRTKGCTVKSDHCVMTLVVQIVRSILKRTIFILLRVFLRMHAQYIYRWIVRFSQPLGFPVLQTTQQKYDAHSNK